MAMTNSDMLLEDMKKKNNRTMPSALDTPAGDLINNDKRSAIDVVGDSNSCKGDSGSRLVVSPKTRSSFFFKVFVGGGDDDDDDDDDDVGLDVQKCVDHDDDDDDDHDDGDDDVAPSSYSYRVPISFEQPSQAYLDFIAPKPIEEGVKNLELYNTLSEDMKKIYLKQAIRARIEWEGWKQDRRRELLYKKYSLPFSDDINDTLCI